MIPLIRCINVKQMILIHGAMRLRWKTLYRCKMFTLPRTDEGSQLGKEDPGRINYVRTHVHRMKELIPLESFQKYHQCPTVAELLNALCKQVGSHVTMCFPPHSHSAYNICSFCTSKDHKY
jgi:hypothetical protein